MTTPISDEQLADLEQAAIEIKGWNLVDAFRYADPCIEDAEDEEWCVGSIDEDGNQYPVMGVNAHQYDSQDSELLAHYYGLCNRESILGLIARLRAAEAELSLWRPIMDEVERRAEKEWCLQDKSDFTVTIQYDDYVAIDSAMESTP
ncbi:TPA: hypothetical protein ACJ5AY_001225 [Pseudomonas aeruginosa]